MCYIFLLVLTHDRTFNLRDIVHSALGYSGATAQLILGSMLHLNAIPTTAHSYALQSDRLSLAVLWDTISRMSQEA